MICDELPDWLDREAWAAFIKMRKKKGSRAPLTEEAEKRIILKLDTLRLLGHPPGEVLWQSVECGWSGVFPLKVKPLVVPVLKEEAETAEYKRTKAWLAEQAARLKEPTASGEGRAKFLQLRAKL